MKRTGQKASLKISHDVVETIARVAATEIDGVASVGDAAAWNKKPIEIRVSDGVAEISISLILKYGAIINDTCIKVQKAVKENVQTMTGIMVSKVNISVEGIELPEYKEKAESEESSKRVIEVTDTENVELDETKEDKE